MIVRKGVSGMRLKKSVEILRGGKFKVCLSAVVFCLSLCHSYAVDESATGWAADTIAVDAAQSFRVVSGEALIGYNTDWCTGTNVVGATVVLKAVSDPESENAATTTVSFAEGADPASGSVGYEGSGYTRFIMTAELDGEAIGEPLVSDISFGVVSASSAAMAFDGRTNSLQKVIDAKATASLRYDLLWGNVASNAAISLVCVRRKKNGDILDVTTNELYDVDAFYADSLDFSTARLKWGDYRLLLQEYAGDGSLLLEMLSPEFSIQHIYGTCFIIR